MTQASLERKAFLHQLLDGVEFVGHKVVHPTVIFLMVVLSSAAPDAGYLVLIPLGGAAFMSLSKNPVAGLAAAFSGVAAVFGVDRLITPIDGVLAELTKDAIHHAVVARPQHWGRRRSTTHRAVSAARSYKCHA